MKSIVLHESSCCQWIVLGRDESRRPDVIDTNQYVIRGGRGALLLDPEGIEVFPQVLAELARHLRADEVTGIFSSHQDPDVISSLSMWLDLCPNAKVYTSWLWTGFIAHFCMGNHIDFVALPDEGGAIAIGNGSTVELIPAHYCHSSGNFSLYDPEASILYSGDIGAAMLPSADEALFVEDFDRHVVLMEGFHRRWMPSNRALRSWVDRVRLLDPKIICPQHGSIFRGFDVSRFLDWQANLDVEEVDPNSTAVGEILAGP